MASSALFSPRFSGEKSVLDIERINADLDAIDASSSSPLVKACAQMLWTVRDFLREQPMAASSRPLQEWSVHDILRFVTMRSS